MSRSNKCVLCKKAPIGEFANNAAPLVEGGKCCNKCNAVVCFARVGLSLCPGVGLNSDAFIQRIRSNDPALEQIYMMYGGYSG